MNQFQVYSEESKMSKQTTLAAFGFTKKINHRGIEQTVEMPLVYKDIEKKLECHFCKKMFFNNQGLSVHLKCRHGYVPELDQGSTDSMPPTEVIPASSCKATTDPPNEITTEPSNETANESSNETANESSNETAYEPSNGATPEPSSRGQSSEISEQIPGTSSEKPIVIRVENRRGSQRRISRTNIFKAKVIEMREAGKTPNEIVEMYSGNLSLSLISKWMKNRANIIKAAASEQKQMFKIRPGRKYTSLYSELIKVFTRARSQGKRVDFNWIWSKARKINREVLKKDREIRKHVVVNFIKRHHLKLRRTQRNKKVPKESLRADLQKWHATTRERLICTGSNDDYHPKWGRFLPKQRFNVDQSPLPFAIDVKKTYEQIIRGDKENRNNRVWVCQPFSGADKRQCSLNICFRPDGEQPRIAVIFRGQGKRISKVEKEAWDSDVDIYFQPCAWADERFCIEHIERTLKPVVEKESRFVLYCDNLAGQNTPEFREAVSKLGGVVWYGLKNGTDLWQPVDAGYAEKLKTMIKHSFFDWLDDDDNSDKWYGTESFTASERRVLLTKWIGDAYRKLIDGKWDSFRNRMFEKTGCLITADGSGDSQIQPEGLKDYQVPPPAFIPADSTLPIAMEVESQELEDEFEVDCDIEREEDNEILVFDAEENIPTNMEVEERNLFDFLEEHI